MRRNVVLCVLGSLLAVGIVVVEPASGGQARPLSGAVVKTAYNKTLKTTILVDGAGMTLYLYTADRKGVSACAKDPSCTPIWYALKPGGHVTAGGGVKASLLGTTTNGKQVTYNGHPLYTFHGCAIGCGRPDTKPGQVNGQGFYYTWYVVSPEGKALKKT